MSTSVPCVDYRPGWLPDPGVAFAALQAEIAWEQHEITMFGRTAPTPRLTAWMGGAAYRYSGVVNEPAPWPPRLAAIRDRLAAELGVAFNSCLANLYRDGSDSMGWHSDDEPELGPRPTIASVSLGARRTFALRHRGTRQRWSYELGEGDLLVMRDESQADYAHAVPKTARPLGPRMNLTFRRFRPRGEARRRPARQGAAHSRRSTAVPDTPTDLTALLPELTLAEKASLVLGSDFWHTAPVPRLGVPAIMVADGPHGLRAQMDEADHVGLSGSVPATCFPTASGLSSSWNPDLFRTVGEALGREARRWGVSVLLGPGINIKRSPLCGRNFEYVSEDPWLTGELATAMVHGVQSLGVGTSLKHYAANNQEDDRLRVSAEVDERTLREIYLPAFERVVTQAQPWTVMCAYNKVNGIYASEHAWLLTEVLRGEWRFAGLVVSDWGAVADRVAAVRAGLDLEMPPNLGVSDAAVATAVRAGELDEAALDRCVARVLRLVEQAQPALAEPTTFDEAEHHALARRAAHESAVLLKNEGGVLPLQAGPGSRVVVIGEFAQTPRYQGAGSSQVNPTRLDVALDELRAGLGSEVQVDFAAGFAVGAGSGAGEDSGEDEDDLRRAAVDLARGADAVVLFLGLPAEAESEGFDRTHMDLPDNQVALVSALAEVHDRIVVVLANGSSVRMSTWVDQVAAVLECWLSGQAAGGAAADLLLGVANPSGRLAETIPVRLEDNPSYLNFPGDSQVVRYGEGIFVGYRGYDKRDQAVSYPFGFGLSYTTFAIGEVRSSISGSLAGGDLTVTVSASVTNTGEVAGAEVVQVYVADLDASEARPVRELKAFAKVTLEPGETRAVTVELDERSFAFWSLRHRRWTVEAGEFEIAVGSSSRDLAGKDVISIEAPAPALPLGPDSTLHEWLADERGREILESGTDSPVIRDPEMLRVIGTMPLGRLAAFRGMGFDGGVVEKLVSQL